MFQLNMAYMKAIAILSKAILKKHVIEIFKPSKNNLKNLQLKTSCDCLKVFISFSYLFSHFASSLFFEVAVVLCQGASSGTSSGSFPRCLPLTRYRPGSWATKVVKTPLKNGWDKGWKGRILILSDLGKDQEVTFQGATVCHVKPNRGGKMC